MFESMQRRWEMRRLMSRLEAARRRKEMAMEAFVSGRPTAPVLVSSFGWSQRIDEQPDASEVAEAIDNYDMLEAEMAERQAELHAAE